MENKDKLLIGTSVHSDNLNVERKVEFELFTLWNSLPPLLKNPPLQRGMKPETREFAVGMGIEDEQILELLEIKTQKEFALKYGLSPDTLTDWKKLLKTKGMVGIPVMQDWVHGMAENLSMSLYNHAMKKGNPLTIKLWFQLMTNWKESATVEHTFTPISNINHEQYDQSATDILEKNS